MKRELQLDRFGDRLVEDAHLVVGRHGLADAAQHGDRLVVVGLVDLDDLEAAGEGGILLEVLLVFGPGGGGNRAHFAARQRRLEQVGGIVLAGRAAGADQGMRLVDEHDDGLRAGLDLFDHALQAVLELALHAGAGLQQAQVQRQQFHAMQDRRHVVLHDAHGQAFDHGGLAHARFASEDRVVLATAGQHVDHQADFRVAAQHRVQVPIACALGQVDAVLVQVRAAARLAAGRAARARRRTVADRASAGSVAECTCFAGFGRGFDQRVEILGQGLEVDFLQRTRADADQAAQFRIGEQGDQQVAAAHLGFAEFDRGPAPAMFEQLWDHRRQRGRALVAALEAIKRLAKLAFQCLRRDFELAQDAADVAVLDFQQFQQQVLDLDVVVTPGHAQARRAFHRAAAGGIQTSDERA